MKSVQIPYELFVDLVLYHLNGEDDFDEEIRQGLEQKLDAMLNRQLYSQYKTASTEEQREQARQEYLDRRGVPQSYRWTTSRWELLQERATLLWMADKAKHWLTQTPTQLPSPSKNPQILRWMAERIFEIFSACGGGIEANSVAERLTVTPYLRM